MNFGTAVYVLCAILSGACAWLLLRAWARGRERLLLWSGLCFVGLAANNVLLFVDLRIMTQTDLSLVRMIPSVIGISILIFGLVWETR
ncbi:MAG TPA: DUF5985 family protein [Thermoanaerobaculia bacterium]|nr:DUF5985 family protein [Thermoanaerobaculia bacterium]